MPLVRYRQDAGDLYVPGYPADPDLTLELPEEEAARLLASGLYRRLPEPEPAPDPAAPAAPPADEPAEAPARKRAR